MILTDKKIRELAKENELITPFEEENLQSESYDVTIGTELIGIQIFPETDISSRQKNMYGFHWVR